ncbi:hypothetical protein [Pelagibacterium lentulum]|uniref:Uncharacterized protein n=1 Tax=Pelagibacterium lentulum TaxID=2029865 RepID=A0A916RPL4_9HYPH|nr:hypothetical protein [Pelagibacterium lentulum]GGA63942.1 hypothetical protein GCM10011499_37940 [Pelagibacterium lentulum]
MALTEPLDLLDGLPGWAVAFELQARQEQSRSAAGRTRVKDFGQPLWVGSWVTRTILPNTLDIWHARLNHAMNSQMTFRAWKSSRCRPIAHPGNSMLPEGSLYAIGANDNTVRVEDLPGVTLSIGDMLRIGTGLYEVLEPASGDPTAFFTIQPHLWVGTATGQKVVISKPWVAMTIDPGSVSTNVSPATGRGTLSFTATESR